MAIKTQLRRRFAAGVAGTLLVAGLVLGNVAVAADGDQPEPRDVNVGKEATGMADQATFSINSVTVAPAVSAPAPAAALAGDGQVYNQHNHDDSQDTHDGE